MLSNLFEVVDQNNNFVVINKAAGVNFHDEGELNLGLFNQVKQQLNLSELYPVHRLDKMTSGLLIFAKNKTTANDFLTLFSKHKIEKLYLALSEHKPKKKQGVVKGDMAKSRRGAWKLLRTFENPAISQFFSFGLGKVSSNQENKNLRLFIIKPHSGKTHQIRVALNSLSAPILGDVLYNSYTNSNLPDRGYLHAYALRFSLNNTQYEFILPPNSGEYFTHKEIQNNIQSHLAKPWDLPWPKI